MPYTPEGGIEAIFKIIGSPATHICQYTLALDKWISLFVAHIVVMVALAYDTSCMPVSVMNEYQNEVLDLLQNTWHPGQQSFHVKEMEQLVSKLGRIGQAYCPMCHLMT